MQSKIIAIDGPAGAGKSTIAKKVAGLLGFTYIDSGAMYRAITLKLIRQGIDIKDLDKVLEVAQQTEIDFHDNHIYLDGDMVDREIREEIVNTNVSPVSAIPELRRILVSKQRNIAGNKNVVMDGRDVGTVIFPHAYCKIFLTATSEERALRRYTEMLEKGKQADFNEIKRQIEERDRIDTTRKDSPLKAAEDAVYIDTTARNIDEVVAEVIKCIERTGESNDAV